MGGANVSLRTLESRAEIGAILVLAAITAQAARIGNLINIIDAEKALRDPSLTWAC
jgi:hypothetical protein